MNSPPEQCMNETASTHAPRQVDPSSPEGASTLAPTPVPLALTPGSVGPRLRARWALVWGMVAVGVAGLVSVAPLWANGGTLRLANVEMGAYLVSVFTDPTPVRPDSLDVSVLIVQRGMDGVPEGLDVRVRARLVDGALPVQEEIATRETADDPRYYAAKFSLGAAGTWEITVDVAGEEGTGSTSFELTARDPGILGNPLVLLLLGLLPLAALGVWLMRDTHQGRDPSENSGAP
jgi:hypothetical protein